MFGKEHKLLIEFILELSFIKKNKISSFLENFLLFLHQIFNYEKNNCKENFEGILGKTF
jgi:hypothetical protein